jgi:hypothetical protein
VTTLAGDLRASIKGESMADQLSIKKIGSAWHDRFTILLDIAFERALARESEVSDHVLSLPGMSGKCYRMFINNLVRLVYKPRYLEVGSWAGSTACSVIEKNVVSVLCIDNWSLFGGPKDAFFSNVESVRDNRVQFRFIESDFRAVDISEIGAFNIYLFDGPHEERDQYDGLALYDAALDDDLFFIVDDWNWPNVRKGTVNAIRDTGFNIDFVIEVRTTQNNEHASIHGAAGDWHNGYFLSKVSRRNRRYSG